MSTISISRMLEAGVHFGHKTRFWNPKMAPYIYGARHEIHIINLEETLPLFNRALKFIGDVAARRGRILFVGTKQAASDTVREEAMRCGMPYVNYRWLGGMLTNYKTIRQSIKRFKELEERCTNLDNFKGMTKKETLQLIREKDKLAYSLAGIKDMGGLPDVLFVIDVGLEKIAVSEAKRLGIPVVGIVDTNTNPEGIDYLIPGNDDAQRSIRLYCQAVADMILEKRSALKPEEKPEADKKEETVIIKKRKVVQKAAKEKSVVEEGEAEEAVVEAEAETETVTSKKPAAAVKKASPKKTTAKKTKNDVNEKSDES